MLQDLEQAEAALAELHPQPFFIPLLSWAPIVAGAFAAMSKRHWIVTGPRSRIGAVLRGCAPERLLDQHTGARPYKISPSSLHPANRALHAVGIAMATKQPTLCILGDAGLANGAFWEALNIASLQQAPVVFLLIQQPQHGNLPMAQQYAPSPLNISPQFGLATYTCQATASDVQNAVNEACGVAQPALVLVQLEK